MWFHEFFQKTFCKFTTISVSGGWVFILKTCQIVAGASMIRQFHEFSKLNFWLVFAISNYCVASCARSSLQSEALSARQLSLYSVGWVKPSWTLLVVQKTLFFCERKNSTQTNAKQTILARIETTCLSNPWIFFWREKLVTYTEKIQL